MPETSSTSTSVAVRGATLPSSATAEERWGDFILTPDLSRPKTIEADGTRADFPWANDEGPWDHHLAQQEFDAAVAKADPRVPWPALVPSEEQFLLANVIADDRSAAEGAIVFIRSGHPDVQRYASPGGTTGGDRTLMVSWSTRWPRPIYFQSHLDPIGINSPSLAEATVVEDAILKVTVKGHPGILRVWSSRSPQQNMYGGRLPTVIINWFEGGVLWTVQSTFLTPQEALDVAESIRLTQTS